jgi:hypothetical protein
MNRSLSAALFVSIAVLTAACGGGSTSSQSPATQPASNSPTSASVAPGEFGVAECDAYMKKYLACIDRMPEAARTSARQVLDQTRSSWQQAAATEQGRAGLAMACKSASDAAAASMGAYGCW